MVKVLIRETFGSDESSERLYVQNEDQIQSLTVVDKQNQRWFTLTSIKMFLTSVFLPSGYPESVSDDYTEYQIWDSIQAFASSIMNNLGTHAVLKGVGVGDSSATVLSATITWLLRDGTSMSGRIIFAYLQSSKLDSECKKWRLFADLINDLSIFIDLLSPYFSNYFLYLQCFSGVLKALVGTAGGATRAALTQHQSRRNNMADVSAKDGSQETLVNLTALFCSLIIVPIVSNDSKLVWILFITFAFFHIYANYRAVKSVSIEVFNLSRFAIFVEHYLRREDNLLDVKQINSKENVWVFFKNKFDVYSDKIAIGVPVRIHISNAKQLNDLINIYSNDDKCSYILSLDQNNRINISVNKYINCGILLEAVFQSILICLILNSDQKFETKFEPFDQSLKDPKNTKKLLEFSRKFTIDWIKDLEVKAKTNGWDLTKLLIIPNEWRFQIKDSKLE